MTMAVIAMRPVWPSFARTERAIAAFAVALVLVLVALPGADGLRTPLPAIHRTGDGAATLPIAARGAISAALGRDQVSYHARPTQDGFAVDNVRHDLEARFRFDGLRVREGATELGLVLGAWGYGEALSPVAAAAPEASANRVEYRRGPLTEWYVNGPLGLQQGFTLLTPPPRAGGALTLAVPFSGTQSPSLDPSGESLTLAGSSLQYRGLIAFDATGRELPAWLEVGGRTVLLRVEDRGALYPLTIDPFVQQAKLTASDGTGSDALGSSVAVSGDTVVVGAPTDDVGATANQGSAYVFVKPASGWANATETAKLTASDGASGDQLGFSVAVSGDTVVAGASLDNVGANADQGSAYVFVKPASGWASATETAKLTASDGASGDELGRSVAASGDTVVGGAWLDDAPAANQGSAYVFVKPASGWASATQTAKLTASDGAAGDNLGVSITVSGDTVVAGAPADDIGVNANQGSAYVFVKPASGWGSATETEKLTASDGAGGDQFGLSVAVSGDTVVAGAPVDGAGSAYVFGPQVIVPPRVSIDDVTVAEGNSGTSDATFTVTLSEPSSQTVTVDFATADGTASAGSDYHSVAGTLTFAPGDTSETVTVPVIGDTLDEPDETFFVNLSNPVNATIADDQGQGTIVNDEPLAPPGTLHDVGVAGGGFNTRGRVDESRDGLGPFPVKIKVKNFGGASEDIFYAVSSSESGMVFSAACSGVVFDVPPNTAVLVSGCTVTYADAADPDPILTLTVSHNDGDGGTDSNPANNTDLKAIVINP